jgi:hypothetical protein
MKRRHHFLSSILLGTWLVFSSSSIIPSAYASTEVGNPQKPIKKISMLSPDRHFTYDIILLDNSKVHISRISRKMGANPNHPVAASSEEVTVTYSKENQIIKFIGKFSDGTAVPFTLTVDSEGNLVPEKH